MCGAERPLAEAWPTLSSCMAESKTWWVGGTVSTGGTGPAPLPTTLILGGQGSLSPRGPVQGQGEGLTVESWGKAQPHLTSRVSEALLPSSC